MTHRILDQAAVVETVCKRIAEGKSLRAACDDDETPAVQTFLRWCDESEEVEKAYRRALEAKAEWYQEERDRIRRTAVDRESAYAAKVQLNALEWDMERSSPRRYSPRVNVAVDVSHDLSAIIDRRRQRVLEAEAMTVDALPAPDGEQ